MNNNNEKQTWNYNWKARLKRNVLIFDLKVLSSQLTGMEFHILGAACEKAMIKQTPIIYNNYASATSDNFLHPSYSESYAMGLQYAILVINREHILQSCTGT